MKSRQFAAAIVSIAAFSVATLAVASPERRSADACAQALAERLATKSAIAPKYSVLYKDLMDESLTSRFYNSSYTFDLSVQDPKSGAQIAAAKCVTRTDGTVMQLTSLPVIPGAGKLAAAL